MDESGFPLDPKPPKGVFARGEKNPVSVSSGNKAQITVVGCVSAAGQCMPPTIIWPRKKMPPELAFGEVPGSTYGVSQSGWMNQLIFSRWFKQHFLRYVPAARPLLLLLDGHSSHYCPDTLKLAQEDDVITLALPPNTTHLTQPLDKGVFGPLKMRWRQVVHDFQVSHPGQTVTQWNFCRLFSKAWLEAMNAPNISAGFRTTGIYPLNFDALKVPCQVKAESPSQPVESILPYTPAKCEVFRSEVDRFEDECAYCEAESPLTTTSDYFPCKRRGTVKMLNVETLPSRDFKKKPALLERDPSRLLLTSAECILDAEDKRKAKEARAQRQLKKELKKAPSNCQCKVDTSTAVLEF